MPITPTCTAVNAFNLWPGGDTWNHRTRSFLLYFTDSTVLFGPLYLYMYVMAYVSAPCFLLVQRRTKMRFFPSVMASFLFFVVVGLACVELSTCLVVKGSVTCLDCTHHLSGSTLFFFSFVFRAWAQVMIGNATTKLAYSSEAAMAPVTNGLDLYKCHMLGEMAFLKSYHFPHSSDDTSIFMSFYPCFSSENNN